MLNILRSGVYGTELLVTLAFYIFAVLSALILHEVSHGWIAYKQGDPTAKFAGRLNLNPVKHLDPLGTLCFLFVGIGWAKPVPINPYNFRNFKKGFFLVSIAGIVTNFILGFIASFFFVLLYKTGTVWLNLFLYLMLANVSFAVFNLLPVPPLDGFNIFAGLAKPDNKAVRWLRDNAMIMVIVLLLVLQFTNIIGLAQTAIINLFLDFWSLLM
jgi:Zn-dependent protease